MLMKKKKLFSIIMAILMLIAAVVTFNGGSIKKVNAGGLTNYVIECDGNYCSYYKESYISDETFDSEGNITVEYGTVSDDDLVFYVADNAAKKIVINDKSWKLNLIKKSYIIVNKERIIKLGEKFTLNKSDFKKDDQGFYLLTLDLVEADSRNQWSHGFWFDSNGENTYDGIGSWKGSGDYQWFEDTNGWYPAGCWQRMDRDYDPWSGIFVNSYSSASFSYKGNGTEGNKLIPDVCKVRRTWYYFDSNGYVAINGWYKIDGAWYYFNEDALYETMAWRDGYYIDEYGIQTYPYTAAWHSDSYGWWYEDASGWYPVKEWVTIDGQSYYFNGDGYMAHDEWICDGDGADAIWYYLNSSGVVERTGNYNEKNEWVENYYSSSFKNIK